jgi:hypothetical protein
VSYTQDHTKLGLNIARIEVPDTSIRVGVFEYDPKTGHDDLKSLRDKHRGSHAVARRRDQIVCLPRIQDAPPVGEAQEDLPLCDNLSLVAALLRETLIDHFCALSRPVISHRPITFLGVNDLLKEALPKGLSAPAWLVLHNDGSCARLRPRRSLQAAAEVYAEQCQDNNGCDGGANAGDHSCYPIGN